MKSIYSLLSAGQSVRGSALALLGLLAVLAVPAHAGNAILADTTMVTGSSSDVFSFQAPGPGTVTVELTNVAWPQPLTSLSFMAMTPGQVLASWSDPATLMAPVSQTESFQVTSGGTYFADVTANAGGTLDLGVYSLWISFTPANSVPLPSSALLLLSALVAGVVLLWVPRHRRARAAG